MTERRIAITGATGMVGSALTVALRARGDTVVPVSRQSMPGGIQWDPAAAEWNTRDWEGLDAVVHLAGENLAGGRWTDARKAKLRDSRVKVTHQLSEMLASCVTPPRTLIIASAVGAYGDTGEAIVDESAPLASDFLGTLVRDWESAADPARAAGIRVVHTRFGMILSPTGGALERMLPIFKLGLGGRLGNGHQWMSWVTIDDVVAALLFTLDKDTLSGAVNVTSPNPVRNREFTAVLANVLRRPGALWVPAFALRAVYGEMAVATLLVSQRVVPTRLTEAGFDFHHLDLNAALTMVL